MKKRHLSSVEERLNTYIRRGKSCWVWTGYKGYYGYGKITDDEGKQVRAHRYLYEMFKGKIPKGMNVLHTCDNTACVNPEHLYLGTQKDNVKDMMSRDRGGYKRFFGESHHNSKLKKEDIILIKEMWATGKYYQSEIATKFAISQQVVSKIVNLKAWKVLEGNEVIKINK